MKIAVNTRLLLPNRLEGIGWFSYEILRRIVVAHPEHEFYFLFDRKPDPAFIFAPNVKPLVLFPQSRHPILWYIFVEISIPIVLKKYDIDLFISPDGFIPTKKIAKQGRKGKSITFVNVIHDLSFEHFKGFIKPSHERYYRHYFPLFAKAADKVITVSEFSKKDIIELYKLGPTKIEVVYNAANQSYKPLSCVEKDEVRLRYTASCPFFIYVGSVHKRKNVLKMLQAFDMFKAATGLPHKFVLVGTNMWKDRKMEEEYKKLHCFEDTLWLGRVEPQELNTLVASAEALMYASIFEGFGIPIVEAFAAETAVITSNVSSMPEVGGDAVLYVDPYSVESISDGMCRIVSDTAYRNELISKGRIRKELFSWDKSADKFWQVIEDSLISCGA